MTMIKHDHTCFICKRPALMGFHPICFLEKTDYRKVTSCTDESELENPTQRKTICVTCPFRRTKKSWMIYHWWVVNKLRLMKRKVQNCHQGDCTGICAGSQATLKGGNGVAISPSEFDQLDLCNSRDESISVFNALKFGQKVNQ